MPSNNTLINYTISYEVNDDEMLQLMKWLKENGQKGNVPNVLDKKYIESATYSRVKS